MHVLLPLLPTREVAGILKLDPLRPGYLLVVGRHDKVLSDIVRPVYRQRRNVDSMKAVYDRPPIENTAMRNGSGDV